MDNVKQTQESELMTPQPRQNSKPLFPNNLFLLLLGSCTIVLIFVVTYVTFITKSPQQQYPPNIATQPSLTPLPSGTSVNQGDPTADWKTYTNTQLGFLIKYPVEMKLIEDEGFIILAKPGSMQKINEEFINLVFSSGPLQEMTLKEVAEETVNLGGSGARLTTTITIADVEGYLLVTETKHEHIFLPKGQGGYFHIINSTADPTGKGYQGLVKQILSTFRFLGEKETPSPSQLPPPVKLAQEDLAKKLSIPPSTLTLVELKAVEWSDGSIGCPRPDAFYIQVITPGYRVVFSSNNQEYIYHTDMKTRYVACSSANETQ